MTVPSIVLLLPQDSSEVSPCLNTTFIRFHTYIGIPSEPRIELPQLGTSATFTVILQSRSSERKRSKMVPYPEQFECGTRRSVVLSMSLKYEGPHSLDKVPLDLSIATAGSCNNTAITFSWKIWITRNSQTYSYNRQMMAKLNTIVQTMYHQGDLSH